MQALEAIAAQPAAGTATTSARPQVDPKPATRVAHESRRPGRDTTTANRTREASAEEIPAAAAGSTDEQRQEAVESLREQRASLGTTSFKISYDEDVSRYIVQIVDRATGDEIQQIPPEELIEVSRRLGEMRGLLFDEKS